MTTDYSVSNELIETLKVEADGTHGRIIELTASIEELVQEREELKQREASQRAAIRQLEGHAPPDLVQKNKELNSQNFALREQVARLKQEIKDRGI